MNEETRQRLSALVDQELPQREHDHALRELTASADTRAVWARYHLIGDVLRGEWANPGSPGIAGRVRQRLREEPTVLAPALLRKRSGRSLRPLAGVSIAASVAAAVVLVGPRLGDLQQVEPVQTAQTREPLPLVQPRGEGEGTRWDLGKPELESKLNAYLVNHHKYAPAVHPQGMISYASFAGYDLKR